MTAQHLAWGALLIMAAGGIGTAMLYLRKTGDGPVARAIWAVVFFVIGGALTLFAVGVLLLLSAAVWSALSSIVTIAIWGDA